MLRICVINTKNKDNFKENGEVVVNGFGSFEYKCSRFSNLSNLKAISREIKKSDVLVIEALKLTHYSKFSTAFEDQRMEVVINDAIGYGKQLILAPYTDPEHYVGNMPIRKEVLGKALDCYNVTVLQPQLVFNSNKKIVDVIPACEEEILDTICKMYMIHKQHWVKPTFAIQKLLCYYYWRFRKMAREIDSRKYYDDSYYDNFIAMKVLGGIICTNLDANFNSLKLEDLIFVTDWQNSTIEWTGFNKNSKVNYKLPLIIQIYESYQGKPVMISAGYNILNKSSYIKKFYTTKQYILAGFSGQAGEVIEELKSNDGIAVMKQNSSIIMANTFKGASNKLAKFLYDATI